ncbi:unnamed protein product [Darwinula stevensoni]|uniref:Uncharacterized protein n=1 Tax=Darwinula stevensoni TaxID=69355 RepID=A0A7R8X9E4_9CRUS|nr:unnamed protein product [Darwinula stevensoni]CAG0882471.1 unnamed protein product [Darwinula stevensoni]
MRLLPSVRAFRLSSCFTRLINSKSNSLDTSATCPLVQDDQSVDLVQEEFKQDMDQVGSEATSRGTQVAVQAQDQFQGGNIINMMPLKNCANVFQIHGCIASHFLHSHDTISEIDIYGKTKNCSDREAGIGL